MFVDFAHQCSYGLAVVQDLLWTIDVNTPAALNSWGLFLESTGNFSGPKSFMFAVLAFKIKV